jgi:hypothetical protein
MTLSEMVEALIEALNHDDRGAVSRLLPRINRKVAAGEDVDETLKARADAAFQAADKRAKRRS